jgi:hypothetical protein
MISIIICARNNDISPELRENISATIGNLPYEIVVIDNSDNRYNIFSAYNKGVAGSKYPFLLFMHDDIYYHTTDWGHKVVNHFKDEKIGAIGVAGTPYLSFMSGGWWSGGMGYLYLLQSENSLSDPVMQDYAPQNVNTKDREVVALDGVWFCIRKQLFDNIRFDDKTYDGFHFYDVDTTLQVYQLGYRLLSIKDVVIHHLSKGVLDEKFLKYSIVFHEKWKKSLPVACFQVDKKRSCQIEYRSLNTFIGDELKVLQASGKKESQVYGQALKELMTFKGSYTNVRTPIWLGKLLFKYIGKRLTGN